jgi:hypothetical protein
MSGSGKEIAKINALVPGNSPAPAARIIEKELTPRTQRRKERQGGRKGYYIWDYRCISRFILFTIISQTITLPPFFLFPFSSSSFAPFAPFAPLREESRVIRAAGTGEFFPIC